ncbi:MAG: M48 family metallopeptidase [Elusimicrobiota bacterium]|jgi:predicted metal-dependent hydrolase|nr:M48 family metallopeptidase [Elusimicrobiota bacterium]
MSDIPYKLVRSRRKTLALTIDSSAQLVVRSPMRLSEDIIREFIRKKAHWIAAKQRQINDFASKQSPLVLADGENIMYCGNSYAVSRGGVSEVVVEDRFIKIPESMTIKDFANWLRKQCKIIVCQRLNYYANFMGEKYVSVRFSGARSRWGSCGARNTLNFAWRLVMCPQFVIDYVIVHELSHIAHKDHSARFWGRVSTVMPDYKQAQDWLRLNRRLMDII